ncbi:hypothetical protein FHR32_000854 [Streptosporangium album]|uniref:Uncharacterized protein n=1 Tax=Streptosporangium album TaxID=47479 RepID=A0A7W7RQZ0_9ACTN|nr:hypothetical protein [Streptosporangium album]MBB4936549.1 hypothetical protein [Streptosporangium album]
MSLTQGLASPRTPLRRFLDQELSAGSRPLRATYRARLPARPLILPGDGVGYEAGTVGTAVDQRLRLAFTCAAPVDAATMAGIALCGPAANSPRGRIWQNLAEVGHQLAERIATTVAGLALADRRTPMLRTDEDEERLARMLLAAAWYALNYRNPFAFPDTPLGATAFSASGELSLEMLLAVPHRHLIDDVLAQLHAAEEGPLGQLRATTEPSRCRPGPTFDGSTYVSADADLIADGILLEVKSTRNVHAFSLVTIQQLLGYTLMDFSDRYGIDAVGVYLTRAGALITWPIEDYLALLGVRRRDLTELRALFARLLADLGATGCRADDDPLPGQLASVERLLTGLAPVITAGCCRVCAQPIPDQGLVRARLYCSPWCSQRSGALRRRGWLV